jgi:ABC-2 type transport system ATP-binding protein
MIECRNVSLSYLGNIVTRPRTAALQDVSFTLEDNTICGLLGRNGAGKTSLLALLAGYRRPTTGTVLIDGEIPYENPRIAHQTAFVTNLAEQDSNPFTVRAYLKRAALLRPSWDDAYAKHLIEVFELPLKKNVTSLSRGMKAAVQVIIGMASRTRLTLFDEAYLGMDAANRKLFVSELLADYTQNPRTIIFSTHYIQEMEGLFAEAIVLHQGRLLAHEDCDTLRTRGTTVTGVASEVERFVAGHEVVGERSLGNQKEAVIFETLSEARRTEANTLGLALSAVGLQDLFIYMTEGAGEGANGGGDPQAVPGPAETKGGDRNAAA